MGKKKGGFNRKARQESCPAADLSSDGVQVEFNVDETKYDASNVLVLPPRSEQESLKRSAAKEAASSNNKLVKKPLSRKESKRLEKVLEKKQKKSSRKELLDDLQKFQINDEEYKAMASASLIQTKGLKRHFQFVDNPTSDKDPVSASELYKSGKKFKVSVVDVKQERDLNVVGFEEEGDETSSESEPELETKVITIKDVNETKSLDDVDETCEGKTRDAEGKSGGKVVKEKEEKKEEAEAKKTICEPTVFVEVHRRPEIVEFRSRLPIIAEEQGIMEAVRYHSVIVVCGETGSGKTTQVPQFLYEAGYGRDKLIGVTEPRRVAAMAMSKRVGEEMNLSSDVVSYQIRFDNNVTEETRIKFMTDGVLLKELQNDFLLTAYSVIIIDEAHERSVFSDILVGLLSRVVPLRLKKGNPLKLIIMSATLRVEDFTQNTKLFKTPPLVVKVESRQFPVTTHFSRTTPDDYTQAAYSKVCKIHQKYPEGGILVFVTGQHEVNALCRKLRNSFPLNNTKCKREVGKSRHKKEEKDGALDKDGHRKGNERVKRQRPKLLNDLLPKVSLEDYDEDAIFGDEEDDDSDGDLLLLDEDDMESASGSREPLYCLPLYSMLTREKQSLVFKNPPEGSRLCVVATNVAETSLTIPNVKYVIDTGKVKVKVYDKVTGISAFLINWCSKASADQRAGRAGRTSPGHCFRLYSSAVFSDQFSKFSEPEIVRKPVDDLLLQMKALNIDNVLNFPFPSPPSEEALTSAEHKLLLMGALEEVSTRLRFKELTKSQGCRKLTPLGRVMSFFPLSPRYSKMLAFSYQELVPYVIAIVSALTVQEIFLDNALVEEESRLQEDEAISRETTKRRQKWTDIRRKWAASGNSRELGDIMVLLKAVGAAEFVGCTPSFCQRNGLRHKAMVEIHKLRNQLTSEVNNVYRQYRFSVDPNMSPPTDIQAKHLRQVLLSGLFDHVARRIPEGDKKSDEIKKLRNAYQSIEVESPVYLDPNSILKSDQPEFVIYQEIHETSRMQMRNVAVIEPEWLALYAPKMCHFSKPLEDPSPRYDPTTDAVKCYFTATFGPYSWPLPQVELDFPPGLEKYKWFARFLLEGDVIEGLKKYSKELLTSPSTMIKSWAKLQPRTEALLGALVKTKVDSKLLLVNQWKDNPKYLLDEFCLWVPHERHYSIFSSWPPK